MDIHRSSRLKVMATIHRDRPEAPPADTARGFRDLSNILSACYIFQFLQTNEIINHKTSKQKSFLKRLNANSYFTFPLK